MKKKTMILIVCVCAALMVIGAVFSVLKGREYQVYSNAVNWGPMSYSDVDPEFRDNVDAYNDSYLEAVINIETTEKQFFGSIALAVVGLIGGVSVVVVYVMKKNQKAAPKDMKKNFD